MTAPTKTSLSISHMTALDTDPLTFIDLAAANDCQSVTLMFIQLGPQARFPLVTADNAQAVADKLTNTGLRLGNIEACMLTPTTDVEKFRPALELGAELGARGVTAILVNPDSAAQTAALAQLCDLAASLKLRVNIEFMPLMPVWNTLEKAVAMVAAVAKPNLGITIDLLHLIRSGSTVAQIAALPSGIIGCVQLCDSASLAITSDYGAEATVNRLAPGDGVLPIIELLNALPAGIPLEIEVPQMPDKPAAERIAAIVKATRQQLSLAGL